MKQLNLFDDCAPDISSEIDQPGGISWKLFIDGAARNNPGPAGAGIYLVKDEEVMVKHGFFLGAKTNNQAEYFALFLGIFYARKFIDIAKDHLHIFSDSELLVRQCTGVYKIKKPELQKLNACAHRLLEGITYSICHVLREYNVHADALANQGIDKKVKVPLEFVQTMQRYDCHLL